MIRQKTVERERAREKATERGRENHKYIKPILIKIAHIFAIVIDTQKLLAKSSIIRQMRIEARTTVKEHRRTHIFF